MAMEIKLKRSGSIYIIDVYGEMDLYNAYRLKEVVNKMIRREIRNYIINLEGVDYIDSSGIGALLYVHSELKKRKMNLRITAVKGSVKKVIELTKLLNYFAILPGIDEAVQDLRNTGSRAAGGEDDR
jgi:anti-sigma B factor antagonist